MESHLYERIAPYLEVLRELPFVDDAVVEDVEVLFPGPNFGADAVIRVHTGDRSYRFAAEVKNVTKYADVDRLIFRDSQEKPPLLFVLLAPFISRKMAKYLDEKNLNFADLAGNCRLSIDGQYMAFITGNKPQQPQGLMQGIRAEGYQVIFALLAEPALVGAPVRDIAEVAGVGKSTVANRLKQLTNEGFIGRTKSGRQIIRYEDLMDRWLEGYAAVLAPRLEQGRYMTPYKDPTEREERIEEILNYSGKEWAWGGLSAAWRLVRHYRDANTLLHIDFVPPRLFKEIKALPATDGHVILMKSAGPITFKGIKPNTVHPYLVYTQLITSFDERARESANEVYNAFLKRPRS